MERLTLTLARALALCLAVLILPGLPLAAQGGGPPSNPPQPSRPDLPEAATVFVPAAKPVTLRSFNDFTSDATPGQFRHAGHGHGGGVATFDSPWGEQLRLRYWLTPHGMSFEYDDDLKVRYRFAADGVLEEIEAETPERLARMRVGRRAELTYLGQLDPAALDLSAYVLIDEFLRARHSTAFLDGLADFAAPAPVSCTTQGIQCVACVLAWSASVATIANACLVAGVPTLGAACLAAILAHEALNFSCAATCIAWIDDCYGGAPPGTRIPDGCEP